MRIGIDARFYGSIGKGLGRYTSELISQLEKLDDTNEYVIFLRKSNFESYQPKNPRFTKVLAEFQWYSWREQLLYPKLLREQKLDLMHFLHFNVPFFYRGPFVVTIHDLILLAHPTTRVTTLGPLKFWLKFAAYKLVIGRAIKDAKVVLAVSETTREEIRKHFPASRNKDLRVTYEACASSTAATPKLLRTDITQPYAMYVGNAYPHKNLEKLIEAFHEFRTGEHSSWRLVLVGSEDYFYKRHKQEAFEKGWDVSVTFYGHATDEELSGLYDHAAFYVFPSLCEGFGLPPLEAMNHGVPVASSNASCMPEILGEAALYFDPTSVPAITSALKQMADREDLRDTLIEKGRERVKDFSWERCAKETHEAYMK